MPANGVQRVLIANRGECAMRILRTCEKMNLETVCIITKEDASSPHGTGATEICTVNSYVDIDNIVSVGKAAGADSVHPGYGFLSENSVFARACIAAGMIWLGPSPEVMDQFSAKTTAKEIALKCNVPCNPGSPAIVNSDDAAKWAEKIGFPIILKPSGGGGGIGMQVCRTIDEVIYHFNQTSSLAERMFGDGTVFLEKYVEFGRHIEVQVFGDGVGNIVTLGERECSTQRRFQKIIEESPAPGLNDEKRQEIWAVAKQLCEYVKYESAGTVEFIYDEISGDFYFLEVNTRLQVEHGVTEQVSKITIGDTTEDLDIVQWMICQGSKSTQVDLKQVSHKSVGSSIQVRVYAEDPTKNFTPASGILGEFSLPLGTPGARFETWVYRGCEISPNYDPMIVKILQWGPTRRESTRRILSTLDKTVIKGPPNNLAFLADFIASENFVSGQTFTTTLNTYEFHGPYVEILRPGMNTTVQDFPGRTKRGLWRIGVPPSGAMDHLNLRLANSLVGNSADLAGLEVTVAGPSIKFHTDTVVAICGAPFTVKLNGVLAPMYVAIGVEHGDIISVEGLSTDRGSRCYIGVAGGLDVPIYLGSRSTFTKGTFGGHQGRELRTGDVMLLGPRPASTVGKKLPTELLPEYTSNWEIGVLPGPMANPDYMLDSDIEMLMSTKWKVHHNSNRLGIRLSGPAPEWTRTDGGEGGSHPSNIHDCEYAIGTINFTGNMPIIIAHDGPSLGGFVCPITIIASELWKIGQVKANDTIQFRLLNIKDAVASRLAQNKMIETLSPIATSIITKDSAMMTLSKQITKAVLVDIPADTATTHPGMLIRMAGDSYILVEYGTMMLDIRFRIRIHQLEKRLLEENPYGLEETAPGVRSLQIRYNPVHLSLPDLLGIVTAIDADLPKLEQYRMKTKVFHLPLAWDHSGVTMALKQYMQSVRPEAPYLPSNIDFVGANNGLTRDDVYDKVYKASYMCLGLGDVYLGACCAVPVDPRHRLVVPKFNPARTYTQEGTVGLGGAYMCIYPMDSPGGYQLVGRTLPIWNTWGLNSPSGIFSPERPWMLEMFDQIRFYPCPEAELEVLRGQFKAGTFEPKIEYEDFDVGEYSTFLSNNSDAIESYKAQQRAASQIQNDLEKESLERLGEVLAEEGEKGVAVVKELPSGCKFIESPVTAKVWKKNMNAGDKVKKGDVIMVLEAMKMEFPLESPCDGIIKSVMAEQGSLTPIGSNVAIVEMVGDDETEESVTKTAGNRISMQIDALHTAYTSGKATPSQVVKQIYADIEAAGGEFEGNIWITLGIKEDVLKAAAAVEAGGMEGKALYGVPFAVKDNYDVTGWPTTAACPAFYNTPNKTAKCIENLLAAGAILIGKTNLDQFATGLVGTRSPYGACENSFNKKYVSGGSSSGSAVSLAKGFVSFSLGTDTAGSGRVPAQFNNLVGLKPSKGRISCRGMIPACKSLDVASIFALSAVDANKVLDVMTGYDDEDEYSNDRYSISEELPVLKDKFTFGVPRADQLEFFGDANSAARFEIACEQLKALGGTRIDMDFAPFRETADLLYEGPWVAERMAAIEKIIRNSPEAVLDTTKKVIGKADNFNAVDSFKAMYRLKKLQQICKPILESFDVLVTPTAGTIYTIEQVNADPVQKNTDFGYYTNFMNLLDMTAIAVPTGFADNKMPYGITISAAAPSDKMLLDLTKRYQIATGLSLGQTGEKLL